MILLTFQKPYLILQPHEFGSSFSQGEKSPLSTVVFLCPLESIKAGSIRFNSFMVGVLGSRKACRLLDPVYQLNALTAQSLVAFGGGLNTTVKELVMSQHNYTQEPTKNNTPTLNVRLKSFFVLHNANREIIADHLTFDQVKPLSEHITGSLIKFDRMGEAA